MGWDWNVEYGTEPLIPCFSMFPFHNDIVPSTQQLNFQFQSTKHVDPEEPLRWRTSCTLVLNSYSGTLCVMARDGARRKIPLIFEILLKFYFVPTEENPKCQKKREQFHIGFSHFFSLSKWSLLMLRYFLFELSAVQPSFYLKDLCFFFFNDFFSNFCLVSSLCVCVFCDKSGRVIQLWKLLKCLIFPKNETITRKICEHTTKIQPL